MIVIGFDRAENWGKGGFKKAGDLIKGKIYGQ
jgi:hypothetical protein